VKKLCSYLVVMNVVLENICSIWRVTMWVLWVLISWFTSLTQETTRLWGNYTGKWIMAGWLMPLAMCIYSWFAGRLSKHRQINKTHALIDRAVVGLMLLMPLVM